MKLKIDTAGNEKQKLFFECVNNPLLTEIYMFGVKGAAKSYSLVAALFSLGFMYPGTRYFIARNELNDLRKFTTPTVEEFLEHQKLSEKYCKYNGKDDFWQLHNGSEILYLEAGFLPRDPQYKRYGSMAFTIGGIEETGEIEEAAKRNLWGATGRWRNSEYNIKRKLILIGNPCQNFVYDVRQQSIDGTLPAHKIFIETDVTDNKKVQEGYYEGIEDNYSDEEIERLFRNNWDYSNDPALLVQKAAIQDLFTNDFIDSKKLVTAGTHTSLSRISADIAMMGRDKFLSAVHKQLFPVKYKNPSETPVYIEVNFRDGVDKDQSAANQVELDLKNQMIRECVSRSHTIVDADGLGAYLESYLEGIQVFHGGLPAENKIEFFNTKAECAWKLAEFINNRWMKIICTADQRPRIIRELGVLMSAGIDLDERRKRLIDKKTMKKKLGFSPDFLDELIMGMRFETIPARLLKGWADN